MRNKQRQRDQLFAATAPPAKTGTLNKKYLKKEQDKINAVLNPDSAPLVSE